MSSTILLIEDQDEMRAMIETILTLAGYRVLTAANGNQAKEVIDMHAVDLVLTDLLMPEKDGIEVMSDIRRSQPALPVIAMSGGGVMPASFYLSLAKNLGARTMLQKPFKEEVLLAEIEKALAK